MASSGLRVLAISMKEDIGQLKDFKGLDDVNHPCAKLMADNENYKNFEEGPVMLGFVGMKDPIR